MTDQTVPEPYRAMHMLTEMYPPKVKGRLPYWRPKAPAVLRDLHVPVFNWERQGCDCDDDDTVTMDLNGAYLAAASSATFAHGALDVEGPVPIKAPGVYLITAHGWPNGELPSPLGTQPQGAARVWVAHPTAILLDELSREGYWPEVEVHDAYTAATSCRLRPWTTAVTADRDNALKRRALVAADVVAGLADHQDVEAAELDYQAIKDGYSIAVQLMRGPAEGAKTKSKVYRPDWYATIHAQHAASMWRKAWRTVLAGWGPVAMGGVDTVTWRTQDLAEIQMRPVPLLRVDPTGHQLGAFKIRPGEGD